MLYVMHELGRQFLAPISGISKLSADLLNNPFSPYSYVPFAKRISAQLELLHRLGKEYTKPEWQIDSIRLGDHGERDIAVSNEIVYEKPFCKLVHFPRSASKQPEGDPKVLVVAPMSGHHATLLRDTVKTLAKSFDVYITDWVDARMVPLKEGQFALTDYVAYIQEFSEFLGPDVHILAVCQATVPVIAAVSLMAAENNPKQPFSMTLMGGPIDTRLNPTEVNGLAARKPFSWFERELIHRVPSRYPGANRLVYPGFLQHAGFVAMNPDKHLQSYYEYYRNLIRGSDMDIEHHRKFYDEYNAVLDMTAEFYLETIKVVFQEHLLPKGEWVINDVLVDPSKIKHTHLMTIEGELDDITGVGQTLAAHKMCSGLNKDQQYHYLSKQSGHYGIFSGRRWRHNVFPEFEKFTEKAHEAGLKRLAPQPDTTTPQAKKPVQTAVNGATTEQKNTTQVAKTNTTNKKSTSTKQNNRQLKKQNSKLTKTINQAVSNTSANKKTNNVAKQGSLLSSTQDTTAINNKAEASQNSGASLAPKK